jgi:hypothetical protein
MVPADRRIPLSQRQRTGDDIDRFDLSFIAQIFGTKQITHPVS